jgi:hypothetical protein
MFNTIVGAGAVGAGAALRYGSGYGYDQKMRLRLRNTGLTRFLTIAFFHETIFLGPLIHGPSKI